MVGHVERQKKDGNNIDRGVGWLAYIPVPNFRRGMINRSRDRLAIDLAIDKPNDGASNRTLLDGSAIGFRSRFSISDRE